MKLGIWEGKMRRILLPKTQILFWFVYSRNVKQSFKFSDKNKLINSYPSSLDKLKALC